MNERFFTWNDLMKKDASSDYFATLEKGTRVYQRAETGASSFKLKSSGTVKLCLVNGALVAMAAVGSFHTIQERQE